MENTFMTKYRIVYHTILLSALVTGTGIRDVAATPPAYRITDLGSLGAGGTNGMAINAGGQTAGFSHVSSGVYHAFLYDGTMHDLGTLGGTYSLALGINANGQVAGFSDTTGDVERHAFVYDGTLHDLGTLHGTYSAGSGINASGQVSGLSSTSGGESHAFLWTPTTPNGASGTMYDLGTLGGAYSNGNSINDSGQVAGDSFTTGDSLHAFLWTPTTPGGDSGAMIDLGTLGGTNSFGYGINASGQVTGFSSTTGDTGTHAFLYTSGSGMVDLNTQIDPLSGWELSEGRAINDVGQITGSGYFDGEPRAFLLTPIPEPASHVLLALGLPLFVGRNSRRSGSGGTRGAHRPMTVLLKL
jgi:probable HAF family extracellular repeat protein